MHGAYRKSAEQEGNVTEADWITSTAPEKMLRFLRDRGLVSNRKHRLFAVACCRRVWHLLPEVSRRAVEVAEQFADAGATADNLRAANDAARVAAKDAYDAAWVEPEAEGDWGYILDEVCLDASAPFRAGAETASDHPDLGWHAAYNCVAAVAHTAFPQTAEDAIQPEPPGRKAARATEHAAQASLLRCIYGNPFVSVAFEASWRTTAVVALANGVYESRDFTVMSVLADALEDAGCTNNDILSHCRSDGPHVRGCFVVDAVLGKS